MNASYQDVRTSLLIAAFVFVLTSVIYVLTLCPAVWWYDSGELTAACYCLGIAHPTGYPLYTMLGRLFSLLPVGGVALRLNFMSALCAALATAITYLVTKSLILSIWQKSPDADGRTYRQKCFMTEVPALVPALVFAFSPLFWAQTAVAEVYTLHVLFIALLFYSIVLWSRSRVLTSDVVVRDREPGGDDRYLCLFSFLLGLSLGHHLSTLLFVPALLAFIVVTDPSVLKRGPLLSISLIMFLLGLSVDLYLLIRARLDPGLNWGNPDSWGRWWDVVTGAEIRSRPMRYTPHSVGELFVLMGRQVLLPGFVLGAIGIYSAFRRTKSFLVCGLLFFAAMIVYILRNFDFLEDQYLPVFLVFSLWIGLGARELMEGVFALSGRMLRRRAWVVNLAFLSLVAGFPLSLLIRNYASANLRGQRTAERFGEALLQEIEPGSMILSEGSNLPLLLSYHQHVAGQRPDVANVYLFLTGFKWYREQAAERIPSIKIPVDTDRLAEQIMEQNACFRPVYYSPFSKELRIDPGHFIPYGFLFRVEPDRTVPSKKEISRHFRIQDDFYSALSNPLHQTDKDILAEIHGTMGLYFEETGLYEEALREYTRALQIDSLNPGVHYDLGSLAMRTESWDEAIVRFEKVLKMEPGNAQTRYLLGQCYIRTGAFDRASQEMKRIVQENPDDPQILLELGVLYGQMGKGDEAMRCFEGGLKLDPRNIDLLYNTGIARAKAGLPEEAAAYLRKAVSLDSTRADVIHALASVFAGGKEYGQAETYFRMALKLGPDPSVLEDLGFMYRQAGDFGKAAEAWQTALHLDPGNTRLRQELQLLQERMQASKR